MAILRNVIFAFFALITVSVQAETINATSTTLGQHFMYAQTDSAGNNRAFTTVAGACAQMQARGGNKNWIANPNGSNSCLCTTNCPYAGYSEGVGGGMTCSSDGAIWGQGCTVYECPANQNWTVSGTTCTRPDCAAYQTRDATTGVCGCPAGKTDTGSACLTTCPSGYHVGNPDNGQCIQDCTGRQTQGADGQCKCTPSGGVISAPRAALDSSCVGGCSIKWNVGLRSLDNTTVYGYVSFNGSTCSGSTTLIPANVSFVPKDTSGKAADGVTLDPLNKPENNQSPEACDAVGGSWGVYNGASKCLSSKDINTMDKLTVSKVTNTTVNPDGTTTIKTDTTYKTTDTAGIVTTNTTNSTVIKDANGAVVGTGTGTITGTGPDPSAASDLCKNNPGLDICNNRLNKETTQIKILDALQGDGDYSAITNANGDAKKAEADAAHQAHLDTLTNGTFDSTVSSQKQTVGDLIGSWWEPVPMTGCTPYTATIGGRTWTLDICPIAEKISIVSGYAMWVFLAFGVLGLFVKRGAE